MENRQFGLQRYYRAQSSSHEGTLGLIPSLRESLLRTINPGYVKIRTESDPLWPEPCLHCKQKVPLANGHWLKHVRFCTKKGA